MKKVMLCAGAILLSTGLFAQEKKSEIVISLGTSNSYALSYKFGTTTSLWRFNLLSSNVNIDNTESENRASFTEEISAYNAENDAHSIGLSVGKEFRKPIAKQLEFKYGFDIGFNYAKNSYDTKFDNSYSSKTQYARESLTPSINGIIGFNYIVNKNIILGIEVLPNFSYAIRSSEIKRFYDDGETAVEDSKSTSFAFNLDNDTARLSLAYRF